MTPRPGWLRRQSPCSPEPGHPGPRGGWASGPAHEPASTPISARNARRVPSPSPRPPHSGSPARSDPTHRRARTLAPSIPLLPRPPQRDRRVEALAERHIPHVEQWVSSQMRRRSSCKRSRLMASSAPNGSSISRTCGWWARARAIAARWRLPPESCWGGHRRGRRGRADRAPAPSRPSSGRRYRQQSGVAACERRITVVSGSLWNPPPETLHGTSDGVPITGFFGLPGSLDTQRNAFTTTESASGSSTAAERRGVRRRLSVRQR